MENKEKKSLKEEVTAKKKDIRISNVRKMSAGIGIGAVIVGGVMSAATPDPSDVVSASFGVAGGALGGMIGGLSCKPSKTRDVLKEIALEKRIEELKKENPEKVTEEGEYNAPVYYSEVDYSTLRKYNRVANRMELEEIAKKDGKVTDFVSNFIPEKYEEKFNQYRTNKTMEKIAERDRYGSEKILPNPNPNYVDEIGGKEKYKEREGEYPLKEYNKEGKLVKTPEAQKIDAERQEFYKQIIERERNKNKPEPANER